MSDSYKNRSLFFTYLYMIYLQSIQKQGWNVKWDLKRANLIISGQWDRDQGRLILVAMRRAKISVANNWALKLQVQGKGKYGSQWNMKSAGLAERVSVEWMQLWSFWKPLKL